MSEEIFSSRLTRFRESRGLTKESLAKALGVTARYVAMMEAGDKEVEPNSSLYKLFCLMETNQVPVHFDPEKGRSQNGRRHVSERVAETMTEYKATPRHSHGLTEEDAFAQVQDDLEMISKGSPSERRRAFLFLRDHHLPLLAQAYQIDL